jgi:nitrogen fixation protein NifQ
MTSTPSPAGTRIDDYATLLATARDPTDELTLAFAGIIARALATGQHPLIRGLPPADLRRLLDTFFPSAELALGDADAATGDPVLADELADLVDLLLEFRREPSEVLTWLSHAIGCAALGNNHLWQDMGLPDRACLSRLMAHQFPGLAARNSGDMKWKKFFYRQLCERAEVPICKSPNCRDCVDYQVCFGPEEGASPGGNAPV